MKVVPLRLPPGEDLRLSLEAWMAEQEEQEEQAGCLISAVGSRSAARMRLAGAAETTAIRGDQEILSLAGTLAPFGAHLHIAVADCRGAVIGLLPVWRFSRELDPATGCAERRVSPRLPG